MCCKLPYLATTIFLELLQSCDVSPGQIYHMDVIPNTCQRKETSWSAYAVECLQLGSLIYPSLLMEWFYYALY